MSVEQWAFSLIMVVVGAVGMLGVFWGTCGVRNRSRPGRCRHVARGPLARCNKGGHNGMSIYDLYGLFVLIAGVAAFLGVSSAAEAVTGLGPLELVLEAVR